jgi:signal transduction histidine kinase/CheY-like chemotaxis protein
MRPLYSIISESLKELPVSRKIVAITMASSLVTLILLLAIISIRDWNQIVEHKENELEILSRILESNTVASLRFNDSLTAKRYVDSLQSDPAIASVSLYTNDDALFASFSRGDSHFPYPAPAVLGPQWEKNRLNYGANIISDSQIIGKILISLDTRSFKRAFWERMWISLALLFAGLLVSGLLAWRLQSFIVRPISELVEMSRQVAKKRNYRLRADKQSNDEIGSLVESFNNMLETIQLRDETLLQANSKLEQVVEDRTKDLHHRNHALKLAIEAANAANAAKSEFLATTSHELRTPLNPIIGYVDKLLFNEPTGEAARELEVIKQSAELLLRLIDDILDFSLIERGDIRIENSDIDLQKFCRDTLYLMQSQADLKELEIHCEYSFTGDYPFDARPVITTDIGRLKQIVLNFIGNAIKFTNKGSITVKSEIESESPGNNYLRIEIKDTGIGIRDDDLQKLFKPFSQVDGSLSRQFGGMGLGLAISRKFAQALGGDVGCKSEVGVGSSFWIRIPVGLKKIAFEEKDTTTISATPLKTGQGSVLLVEDELVNRELGAVLIKSIGYEVVCARDGFEAVKLCKTRSFDIVFLDIRMPGMDGFETATKLRELDELDKQTPIVAVSAQVTPRDKEHCLEVGMNGSLRKPLTLQKLSETLDNWLGSS